MTDARTITVRPDSGVFRATAGADPTKDPSATGRTPTEALAALAGRLAEAGWDEPGPEAPTPAATPDPADPAPAPTEAPADAR